MESGKEKLKEQENKVDNKHKLQTWNVYETKHVSLLVSGWD